MSKKLLGTMAALGIMLMALVVACGDDDDDTPAATPTTASPVTLNVTFGDNNFTPAALTATAGRPIELKLANGGQRPHTFTIDGVVDSGRLNAGENKDMQFTASQAGSLQFYCTVHGREQMNGTLTVSASGAAEDGGLTDEVSAFASN